MATTCCSEGAKQSDTDKIKNKSLRSIGKHREALKTMELAVAAVFGTPAMPLARRECNLLATITYLPPPLLLELGMVSVVPPDVIIRNDL